MNIMRHVFYTLLWIGEQNVKVNHKVIHDDNLNVSMWFSNESLMFTPFPYSCIHICIYAQTKLFYSSLEEIIDN